MAVYDARRPTRPSSNVKNCSHSKINRIDLFYKNMEDEAGNTILVYHAAKETEIVGDPLYVANRHAMLANESFDKNGTPVIEL